MKIVLILISLLSVSAFAAEESPTRKFSEREVKDLLVARTSFQTSYKIFTANLVALHNAGYENVEADPRYVLFQKPDGKFDEFVGDVHDIKLGMEGQLAYLYSFSLESDEVRDADGKWLYTRTEITEIQLRVEYKWDAKLKRYDLQIKTVLVQNKKGKFGPDGVSSTGG